MNTSTSKTVREDDVNPPSISGQSTGREETTKAEEILDQIAEPDERTKEPIVKKIEGFGSQAREMTG
jgi:hypothetical protein